MLNPPVEPHVTYSTKFSGVAVAAHACNSQVSNCCFSLSSACYKFFKIHFHSAGGGRGGNLNTCWFFTSLLPKNLEWEGGGGGGGRTNELRNTN